LGDGQLVPSDHSSSTDEEKPPWRLNGRRRHSTVHAVPTSNPPVAATEHGSRWRVAVDLTRQLSNLSIEVTDLLRTVIEPDQGPAVPTVAPAIARHTILSHEQIGKLITADTGGGSIAELLAQFIIGKNSLYRHLRRAGVKPNRRQSQPKM
jgi:hypothetical protein